MVDLRTSWLGIQLPHPLVVGASPLADTLEGARRLEEAGAAAIVLRSLFEEQFGGDEPDGYIMNPGQYVAHLARLKNALRIPVIASLNGSSPGRWLEQAQRMESAGADAIELNIYVVPTEPWDPPQVIERRTNEIVRALRSAVRVPVGVKLSPFYTSLPYIAQRIEEAGAAGLTLFNRFYPTDIDLERGAMTRATRLSDSSELPLRLHETAILYGRLKGSIAVSGGVHSATDALKAVAAGAHAVQLVSVLLKEGVDHLRKLKEDMEAWLRRREIVSLDVFRGSLSLLRCPDPRAWERDRYTRNLRLRAEEADTTTKTKF